MKRVLGLAIVICAFASAGAPVALAQSGRARRAEPPKDERADKAEKSDAGDEANDASKDRARDEGAAQAVDDGEKVWTGKEVTVRAVIKSRPL
ncbi:MAG TPA: hypothetical protein VEZ40_15025, partial [Pyrinomonadaceae bacterium]|nr:hypothetical protein [Pyrinomonadaceae bacterium]